MDNSIGGQQIMKRVAVNASRQPVSDHKKLSEALNHMKQAEVLLEEISNDSEFGEFSSYLDEELRTLIQETATELEV